MLKSYCERCKTVSQAEFLPLSDIFVLGIHSTECLCNDLLMLASDWSVLYSVNPNRKDSRIDAKRIKTHAARRGGEEEEHQCSDRPSCQVP